MNSSACGRAFRVASVVVWLGACDAQSRADGDEAAALPLACGLTGDARIELLTPHSVADSAAACIATHQIARDVRAGLGEPYLEIADSLNVLVYRVSVLRFATVDGEPRVPYVSVLLLMRDGREVAAKIDSAGTQVTFGPSVF